MEGFNGTAGPWTKNQYGEAVDPHGEIIHIWGVALSNGVQAKANANLIIAAPELLEALQEMTAIVKKNSYPQPDKPNSNYARAEYAESVIAKALGK